jgi:RNA polymerase subunit RPABC4/transcription elongation factor Spt4
MATCASCQQTVADGTKFCSNCGSPVAASVPAAPRSYAPPGVVYTKFCATCGSGLVSAAVICPNCGSAQKGFSSSGGKSKTTAVVMAVFLSAWTWVYTWKVNSKKFWIALGLWVVQIIFYAVGVSEAANRLVCNQPGGGCTFRSGSGSGPVIIAALISFGVWLWAVVDASTKTQAYYASI